LQRKKNKTNLNLFHFSKIKLKKSKLLQSKSQVFLAKIDLMQKCIFATQEKQKKM